MTDEKTHAERLENLRTATVDQLIAVAEQNIAVAERSLVELGNYSGRFNDYMAQAAFNQNLLTYAQTYIALAEYRRGAE